MNDFVSELYTLADSYRKSVAKELDGDVFELSVQWTSKPMKHVYDLCEKLEEAANALQEALNQLKYYDERISDLEQEKWDYQQEVTCLNNEINKLECELWANSSSK